LRPCLNKNFGDSGTHNTNTQLTSEQTHPNNINQNQCFVIYEKYSVAIRVIIGGYIENKVHTKVAFYFGTNSNIYTKLIETLVVQRSPYTKITPIITSNE
jgi:hypothetical protein